VRRPREPLEVEAGIPELVVDHRSRSRHEAGGRRLRVGHVAPQRRDGERVQQRPTRRPGGGDGLGDEGGELRRGRQGGRESGERRRSDREPNLDPGVAREVPVVERERLAVAREQQCGPARRQHRALVAVDLDPRAALVEKDELHVLLAARTQSPARRVDDLTDAYAINLRQHVAHCGHWHRISRPLACSAWTSPSSNTDATGRTVT
jgi:hypothetical protein